MYPERKSGITVAVVAGVALAALLPIALLARFPTFLPVLALPTTPFSTLDIALTTLAVTPDIVHDTAIRFLFRIVLGIGGGVLVVGGLTILAIGIMRASERRQEMVVKRAVGASRRVLLREILHEGATMVAAAAVLGVALGWPLAQLLESAWPGIFRDAPMTAGIPVLVAVLSLVMLVSFFPLTAARSRKVLAEPTAKPIELILAGFQFGVSLTVLGATSLMTREAGKMDVRSGEIARLGGRVYEVTATGTGAQRSAAYEELIRQLKKDGQDVALASLGTFAGPAVNDFGVTDCGACIGGGLAFPQHPVMVGYHAVSVDSFKMMGARLIAGRLLRESDDASAPKVAVISRSLAERHYQRMGDGALGRGFQPGDGWSFDYTVVGIIEDDATIGFGGTMTTPYAVYFSVKQQAPDRAQLLVREGGPGTDTVLRAVASVPGLVVSPNIVSEASLVEPERAPVAWFGRLIQLEGWVLLLTAIAGIFVLMQLWVNAIRPDLGIMRAVGAPRWRVLWYVLARGGGVIFGGTLFAFWLGILVWGSLAELLGAPSQWDPMLVVGYLPWMGLAVVLGALIPVVRVVRTAPAAVIAEAP